MSVAVCQQEGVAADDDKEMELILPSSKELLKVRQRKQVISSVIIIIIVCQGCFFCTGGASYSRLSNYHCKGWFYHSVTIKVTEW